MAIDVAERTRATMCMVAWQCLEFFIVELYDSRQLRMFCILSEHLIATALVGVPCVDLLLV